MLPSRPRLAEHALARRHLVGGEERVVVHDVESGRTLVIGRREWGLLACADGTRDVGGILLAAARAGSFAREPALREFLEQLHAAGLLADGPGSPSDGGHSGGAPTPADRPLDRLPDFVLACDGSGSCCKIYGSVIFGPLEASRARVLLPQVLDGGADPQAVFLPERGSVSSGGHAVTLVDGRCAYLDAGDRCGLHVAGGPEAKPTGCRLFPATLVDDGERVRVSVSVECACVLESVGRRDGAPLLPESWQTRGDLPEGAFVSRLPDVVAATPRLPLGRAEVVAWSERARRAPPPVDAAARLWGLAEALDEGRLEEPVTDRRPAPEELAPWLAALALRAGRRVHDDQAWRSADDLARIGVREIAQASTALLDGDACRAALGSSRAAASEAFYVRALLHGHQLVGGTPLSLGLRDRAVRILVARAMPERRHALALVEAVMRGHGLASYVNELPA